MHKINAAAGLVQDAVDPDAIFIFGAAIDENLNDEIVITVIATGFEKIPMIKKIDKVVQPIPPVTDNNETNQGVNKQQSIQQSVDELDIPTFLRRNRFK